MPYFYSIMYMTNIPLRLYWYRQWKWQYFCLDFCYMGNSAFLFYLWLYPDSKVLFQVVFS